MALTHLFSLLLALPLAAAQCVPGVYTLEINYLFVRSLNPSAPLSSHLSPLTAFSHARRFSSFVRFGYATPGVKLVAETGDNSVLRRELRNPLVHAVSTTASAAFDGDVLRVDLAVTCRRPYISFITMIAPSPDWIVALFPTDMRGRDGKFVRARAGDLVAYDAGTDAGATLTARDVPSNPVQNIAPLEGAPFNGRTVATYSLTLKGAASPPRPRPRSSPAPPAAATPGAAAGCKSARYRLAVVNMWAKPRFSAVPPGAGLSPLIAASHARRYSAMTLFGYASPGVQMVAEIGDTSGLEAELMAEGARPFVKGVVKADGPTMPGKRTSVVVEVDCRFPIVSFLQMVAPSPDWIIGSANMNTMKGGKFVKKMSGPLRVYDAGTDSGETLRADNKKTRPRENIAPLEGPPFDGRVVARYTLTRM